MSDPAPSTSTDCTAPNASSITSFRRSVWRRQVAHTATSQRKNGWLGKAEAAAKVGLEHARGVDAGAQLGEAVEFGVHHGHEVGAEAGVLREIDAAADTGDQLVEVVEQ